MTSLKAQTQAKVEAGRKNNPDFMAGVDKEIANAKALQQGESALKVGEKAPLFTLPSPADDKVSLSDCLSKGPVVLTFYRGSWCPYCNLQLNALKQRMNEITALGTTLIAISPERPDGTLSKEEMSTLPFTVLSDQGADVAASYGVAWQVPDFLLEHMRVDRGLDLQEINNGNATILPIPATFILNKSGEIIWRYVDVDYRTRSEPDDIIKALKAL